MKHYTGIGGMHHGKIPFTAASTDEPDSSGDKFIDLERLLSIARRQASTVAAVAALGIGLGIAYVVTATPLYTAATSILLDDNLGKFADGVSPLPASMQSDTVILSQIAILKSGELAEKVVEKERLYENEVFMNPPTAFAAVVKRTLRDSLEFFTKSPQSANEGEATNSKIGRAAALLQSGLVVERQGRSLVIDLSYTSHDPVLAGRIARAYADVYLSDQLDANFDAVRRAAHWLQGRLAELREASQEAAMKVERFRTANGLTTAKGTLVSEQQLADINSQLVLAQADTARVGALYNQYRSIVALGMNGAVESAAALGEQSETTVTGALRARYLLISRRLQEITSRFGVNHPQAVALRVEEQEVKRQIFEEIKQSTENYRNQLEVAQSRESSLRNSLQGITGETSSANEALVQLRELEQNALTLGNLYQTYLTRYQEAQQQQSFPIAKARVISIASKPTDPSSPRRTMALIASLMLGLLAGAAVAGIREVRERFFRTGVDVQAALGLKFLGYLPLLPGKPLGTFEQIRTNGRTDLAHVAVDAPGSLFAETLRNVKVEADLMLQGKEHKVISIVSVLPGEGKSTTAVNLAHLLSTKGFPTLLIDADLRNPGLTRSLGLSPKLGLANVLLNEQEWQRCVTFDTSSNVAVIPALLDRHLRHTSELLSSNQMKEMIEEARLQYRYIIVDLPPLGPVVDAKAFASITDAFLMVAEWGRTPRALVKHILETETQIKSRTLGVVLTKADLRKVAGYSSFGASEKFIDHYSSYYVDPSNPPLRPSLINPRTWLRRIRSK
jgi:polysaccharide biosynthesis transport protein